MEVVCSGLPGIFPPCARTRVGSIGRSQARTGRLRYGWTQSEVLRPDRAWVAMVGQSEVVSGGCNQMSVIRPGHGRDRTGIVACRGSVPAPKEHGARCTPSLGPGHCFTHRAESGWALGSDRGGVARPSNASALSFLNHLPGKGSRAHMRHRSHPQASNTGRVHHGACWESPMLHTSVSSGRVKLRLEP